MAEHAAIHTVLGLDPLWVSTVLLVTVYAAIITEKVNRATIALIGAGLMIFAGVLDQQEAIRGIDFNTIALLTGMMILVSISRRSGMFQFVAIWAAQRARAHPGGILALLAICTAILSALLDNVTTVLLIVPVTLAITRELEVAPYPFLFSEIFASNIGGTATLIGDPPNILIGSQVGLTFNDFVLELTPVILVILVLHVAIMHAIWGWRLEATDQRRQMVMGMKPIETIEDWRLLRQSLAVIGLVILGFILADPLGIKPGTAAIFGAAILMALDNWEHKAEHESERVHSTFGDVEWITIFFFVGLFIVVHGVEVGGLLNLLAQKLVAATGGDLATAGFAILWASAVFSAIVDNIPFVATMIPLIKSMAPDFGGAAHILPLWWCLSLGACLGGNGTLIGASANLTVAGIGDRNGVPFRFLTYTLMAFPLMLVTVGIAHLYLWWRFFS